MKCVATHPPTKPTYWAFHTMALSGLLSLAFITPATAADFPGSLKGATITDAQTTNQPPVAAFTYAIEGDTVTFDASGSSDTDGSITKYKWNFGDGTTSEGATVTYTLTSSANLQVTLTVTDNNNGATLSHQTIEALQSRKIVDDFSTDTASNYTILSGELKIYAGEAHSNNAWMPTYAIHNTAMGSNDHTVEADVYYDGSSGTGGLIFRFNQQQNSGYTASFASGRINLYAYNEGKETWIGHFDGKYIKGIYHVKAEIFKGIIKLSVNGSAVLQQTNTIYLTGNQIGLKINPYGDNTSVTVANLAGK